MQIGEHQVPDYSIFLMNVYSLNMNLLGSLHAIKQGYCRIFNRTYTPTVRGASYVSTRTY